MARKRTNVSFLLESDRVTSQTLPKEAIVETKKWPLLGLLVMQFISAFSDNGWKLIVFTLATRSLMGHIDVTSAEFASNSQMQATIALLVFLVPSLFFSLPGGALADRFSKRKIIIGTRISAIFLMSAATLTLFLSPTHLFIPYFILALTGAQSALLSPAKYGILPELVPKEQLSRGNGLLEMWTMLAIIAGTGLGSVLLFADKGGAQPQLTWTAPLWLILLALVGFVSAFKIPHVPLANSSTRGVLKGLREAGQFIRSDRVLRLAIAGSLFYWLIISLLGQNVLVYAKALVHDLSKGELLQGIPPASFGVGIAVGALLGGRLSGERIETGLIPMGATIFAITALLLGVLQPAMIGTVVILLLMGIGSGLLIVPLNALIQWRAPGEIRGSIIAFGNILNTTAMIIGSLFATAMGMFGFNLHMMLVTSSFLVIAGMLWAIWLLPEALVRLIFMVLTRTCYRLKIVGAQNIPKEGAAILTCNHLSLVDVFFVLAAVNRPIRFIVRESHLNRWWMRFCKGIVKITPICNRNKSSTTVRAMHEAKRDLDAGKLVCTFLKTQTSHKGVFPPLHQGLRAILKGRRVPIIPVYNSTESSGKLLSALTISFGKPLHSSISVPQLHKAVQSLNKDDS